MRRRRSKDAGEVVSNSQEPTAESPFDAVAFLTKLERANREREQVAARRPPRDELAKSLGPFAGFLYEAVDTTRQLEEAKRGLVPGRSYAWLPAADSPAADDVNSFAPLVDQFCQRAEPRGTHWLETNPTRNPAAWSVVFLRRVFFTVIDHMRALAELVGSGAHLRAPIVLSRTLLEASSVGSFIIDIEVEPRERLRRILNLHLEELKEASNATTGELRKQYEGDIHELLAFARYCDLPTVSYKPERFQAPTLPGPTSSRSESASRMVDIALPDVGRDMYRSLSAVAHSRDSRTLLPDEYTLPHDIVDWRRTESAAWHSIAPLFVVRLLAERTAAYLGWTALDSWATSFEVVITQWSIAGGLADEQIRSALGLDPRI